MRIYRFFLFLSADIRKGVSEMKKDKFFVLGVLTALLTFGLVFASCDTGTDGGGGNATMILVNNYSESITEWYLYNKENVSPSSQNVTIPPGEQKTIPITIEPPIAIEQIYITAGSITRSGMADYERGKTTRVTLNADGYINSSCD
jgi:hypothetical protein